MSGNNTQEFAAGTQLLYPVFDDRGVLLLNAGTPISHRMLSLLHRRGIRIRLNASLEVVAGGSVGTTFPITDLQTEVGRSEKCKIRPSSRAVSHQHCRIEKASLSLTIDDLDSTNGTWVNGIRIAQATALRDGDVVRFGEFEVRVDLSAALESDGGDVEEVAQLILAAREDEEEPETGETIIDWREMVDEFADVPEEESSR